MGGEQRRDREHGQSLRNLSCGRDGGPPEPKIKQEYPRRHQHPEQFELSAGEDASQDAHMRDFREAPLRGAADDVYASPRDPRRDVELVTDEDDAGFQPARTKKKARSPSASADGTPHKRFQGGDDISTGMGSSPGGISVQSTPPSGSARSE